MSDEICGKTAICNVNVGVALCVRPPDHEGSCMPHPGFWDYV